MNAIRRIWRDASSVQQLGLAGFGLVVLGVGCSVLVLVPAHTSRVALDSRLAALQREIGEARTQVGELARHRQAKVEYEQRLGLMATRLSGTQEIPPLYETLQEAAAQTGLALALFRPREPRVENYYTAIPIVVTAQGTYHRLGRFLARIADLPRLVTIEELKITAIERPQISLRAEMLLTAYVYRPVGRAYPAPPEASAGAPKRGRL